MIDTGLVNCTIVRAICTFIDVSWTFFAGMSTWYFLLRHAFLSSFHKNPDTIDNITKTSHFLSIDETRAPIKDLLGRIDLINPERLHLYKLHIYCIHHLFPTCHHLYQLAKSYISHHYILFLDNPYLTINTIDFIDTSMKITIN